MEQWESGTWRRFVEAMREEGIVKPVRLDELADRIIEALVAAAYMQEPFDEGARQIVLKLLREVAVARQIAVARQS